MGEEQGWRALLSRRYLPFYALICLGVWLNAADSLVTATIMPTVAREIGGYAYFAWATAGYMLGSIVAGASAGRVSEAFGARGALAGSALVYSAGCVLSAASPVIGLFLAGRLVQGVGAGWVVGLSFVTISVTFPEHLWARVFASVSAVWGVATVLGPLIGGAFSAPGLWRGAFWFFGVQGAVFAVAAWLLLRRARRGGSGGPLAAPQLALLTLAILCVASAGLAPEPILAAGLIALGLGLLVLLVRLDARAGAKLLPAQAGDLRAIAGMGYAMAFLLFASAVCFAVYGAAFLQAMHRLSPLTAGYVVGSEAVGWTVAALLVARLSAPWHGLFIRTGAIGVALGLAALALAFRYGGPLAVAAAGGLMGVGFGMSSAFATRRVLSSLPEAERGVGGSASLAVQLTGNAAGAAAAGALGNLLGLKRGITAATAAHASAPLFLAFVGVAALGAAAAWRLGGHEAARAERAGG